MKQEFRLKQKERPQLEAVTTRLPVGLDLEVGLLARRDGVSKQDAYAQLLSMALEIVNPRSMAA